MAEIHPFAALRYSPQQVRWEDVLTQPYDKITPAMQDAYYRASPHNLVRIILGKAEPGDDASANVYTRAAQCLDQWRAQQILRKDPAPAMYLYSQTFAAAGAQVERRGLIAVGRLYSYSEGVVFRHEQTLSKPRADRLNLLRTTRAHFGQIFMLYSDPARFVDSLFDGATHGPPTTELTDEFGVVHRMWMVSDREAIGSLVKMMSDKKLIIADGHHRYETALAYREERRAEIKGGSSPQATQPFDRVMMTLVNMDSPGLVILPTHRVIAGLEQFQPIRLLQGAAPYFLVHPLSEDISPHDAIRLLSDAGKEAPAFIAVARAAAFLLTAKAGAADAALADLSPRQRSLDVVQLHKLLIERALGISEAQVKEQTHVTYLRDAEEAVSRVRSGNADLTFLMNPATVAQVKEVALNGEVLPQKSTDFYPKLLSGLTIYSLDG